MVSRKRSRTPLDRSNRPRGIAAAIAMVMCLGLGEARAQSWNYYDGYTSLPTISFANGPMSTTNGASIYLTMSGDHTTQFVMDTGSTGIIVTPNNFTPGPNDRMIGPGSQYYSSSGLLSTGTYYETDVVIRNTGAGGTAGTAAATARVTVLLVTSQQCTNPNRHCEPATALPTWGWASTVV